MSALAISNLVLWVLVLVLSTVVLALARQLGVLHERIAPAGALMLNRGLTVGEPARVPFKTLQPIEWHPAHSEALLPAMDAEIEVAPMGSDRTQLAMTARYTPPFGLVGRVADRALLHRVAEATIKDFLDRVAARIEERLAGPGRPMASVAPLPSF